MRAHEEEGNRGLSPDFLDFIACLNEHRVDYLLVGGYALGAHGVVRATGDIDFLYRRNHKNVDALCEAMVEFGAPTEVIDRTVLMEPNIVTQFGQPPHRIDLLGEIDGVTFAEAWKGAAEIVLDGAKLRVIGLNELKRNKAATGRKRDRDDLRKLQSLKLRKP
ncbi:MAG TPA: nucleotidyltransferase [Gemmatimonadaceae bacterium]|nr:nucleotidyltransferase [Gemmatimonadaceae bacterium]